MPINREEFRSEVEDWTDSLRSERSFRDLRDGFAERGLNWRTALLACLVENQEGEEHGAVVTSGGKVFRFVREQNEDGSWRFTMFADVTSDPRQADFRDHIEAAQEIVAERAVDGRDPSPE